MRYRTTQPRTALAATLAFTLAVACTGDTGLSGPEGPAGAAGPQGLPGPPGPGTRVNLSAVIPPNGIAFADLPPAVPFDRNAPPAMTCYMSENPAAPDATWHALGAPPGNSPDCSLRISPATGRWRAVTTVVPTSGGGTFPGWTAAWVIVG
jgi:hypothetical protein